MPALDLPHWPIAPVEGVQDVSIPIFGSISIIVVLVVVVCVRR